jgi:small subunit ribosomal protein S17
VDEKAACKVGDIVLIKELSNRPASKVSHLVEEVLYPCGDVTDPVTGQKVVGSQYRYDVVKEVTDLFLVKEDSDSFLFKNIQICG